MPQLVRLTVLVPREMKMALREMAYQRSMTMQSRVTETALVHEALTRLLAPKRKAGQEATDL